MSATDFLKNAAFGRKHPEFAEELRELNFAAQHADNMLKAGKLTKAERADLDALFYQKTMEALPPEVFGAMMADGSLADLEAMAGHDGTRDASDVVDLRNGLYRKIQADALDEAWLDQRVTSEYYLRESRNLAPSESLDQKLNDGDHDAGASEAFASRHDKSTHDADLNAYLEKQYGKEYRGREEVAEKPAAEKAPKVSREKIEADPKKSLSENLDDYLKSEPPAPPSAVDVNGITDLDILAEQGEDA